MTLNIDQRIEFFDLNFQIIRRELFCSFERGQRFIRRQLDSAQSAAESRLYLTAKVFRSGDRTFLDWTSDKVQEDLVKLALTADDQWASSFAATMRQMNEVFAAGLFKQIVNVLRHN